MITKEEFVKFIESYQKYQESIDRLDMAMTGKKYPTILFECDWHDSVLKMLSVFLDSNFTSAGTDWIYYFLFEDVNDKAAYVTKEGVNEEKKIRYSLDTIDELWDFLLTDKKLYFKNV